MHDPQIEHDFIQSWDRVWHFYEDVGYSFAPKVQEMITEMRVRGYDKAIRAGTALFTLVLSKSRVHGDHYEHPHLVFDFHKSRSDFEFPEIDWPDDFVFPDGRMVVHNCIEGRDQETIHTFPEIKLTTEVDALLQALAAKPVYYPGNRINQR
ncbi:MAG: hypothetical protein AAF639_17065 [Chloroflexota bacterium]